MRRIRNIFILGIRLVGIFGALGISVGAFNLKNVKHFFRRSIEDLKIKIRSKKKNHEISLKNHNITQKIHSQI